MLFRSIPVIDFYSLSVSLSLSLSLSIRNNPENTCFGHQAQLPTIAPSATRIHPAIQPICHRDIHLNC